MRRKAMVVAGGTGGHIFPALSVVDQLESKGWDVLWLGARNSMESRIANEKKKNMAFINFQGLRGKGVLGYVQLPFRLSRACYEAHHIIRAFRPNVLIGFGGYLTFPAGIAATLFKIPVIIHEQNAVTGTSNRYLKYFARHKLGGMPNSFGQENYIGNPLRAGFMNSSDPGPRYDSRTGPLRILVVGGSLGAKALNTIVPAAIAVLPKEERPYVIHQSGEKMYVELAANYDHAKVAAELLPFIDDMPSAMRNADLIVCRAGAITVSEISAVGVAALFVPFPFAIDDHQTANANWLVKQQAGYLCAQENFTPDYLARFIAQIQRADLKKIATNAYRLRKTTATETIVEFCEGI